MNPKLKLLVYGLSAFVVYALLTYILRLASNRMPENPDFLGIYTKDDILLGLAVAAILTFAHERKRRLRS